MAPPNRSVLCGGAVLVFGVAFLFQFLTVDFPNDHFVHLSRARQILVGDLPVRDFFDPGLFLQYYASAAALALSGGTLLGEAILTVAFIALGAALTFVVAARLASSAVVGVSAALLATATVPRLYNYPKVFLYVLALACAWRYVHRPGKGGIAVLGFVTALAFLFRHDHGVYIGLALSVCLVVFHWGQTRRAVGAVAQYAAIALMFMLPWIIFVQSTTGLWRYFQGSLPQAREATTPRLIALPIRVDASAPLLAIAPAPEVRIFVRWSGDADAATRRDRESRYGLTEPRATDDAQTSSYVLASDRPDIIRRLIADPTVVDTNGIDREDNRLVNREAFYHRVRRLHLAPGLFTDANALAWLYYGTMFLPLAGLVAIVMGRLRGSLQPPEVALASATVVMCFVIGQGLVRDFPSERLADVAAPTAVLAAWTTSRALTHGKALRRLTLGRTLAVTALWCVTLWSAATVGHALDKLGKSDLPSGPSASWERFGAVASELRHRPIDSWAGSGDVGLRALTRYVFECTGPSDRVLITWFAPEVAFYAERPFAGGQVYLHPGWHASVPDQQLTVERLERERVPLVLLNSTLASNPFGSEFPLVADYVRAHYALAAEMTFGSDQVFTVLTDSRIRPTGTDARFKLPCFR